MVSLLRALVSLGMLCVLLGCGSGFAAVFAGNSGSSAPQAGAPKPNLVSTSGVLAPLVHVGTPLMKVRIENLVEPDPGSTVVVEIRALSGAVADQPLSVFRSGTGSVDFFYDIPNIRKELINRLGSAAFDEDVSAELAVLIDGVDAAPALPITLLKRPIAAVKDVSPIILVSAEGTDVVSVILRSAVIRLPTTGEPGSVGYTQELVQLNNLKVTVAFGDLPNLLPEQSAVVQSIRLGANVGEYEIDFIMPRTNNPTQAQFTIDSLPSGRSSLVSRVFCRPVLLGTSPGTGSTDGGTAVVLFGQALIPSDKVTGELLFEKIKLKVRKGGRISEIPLEMIRRNLSKQNQLVFSMPASPDGTPGPAGFELSVTVAANPPPRQSFFESLTAIKTDAFYYGDTYPNFGPRGVALREEPIMVRNAPFVSRSTATVDALSLTQGPLGVPYVGLFSNRGNGMFVRFGDRIRAGNPEDIAQRNPGDLCIGQFTADGAPSGVIVNRAYGLAARHSLVLGNNLTNPPLRFFESLPVKESGSRCKGDYLNSDAIEDLVVLGNHDSDETPALYLSDVNSSEGGFTRVLLRKQGAAYAFTALEIVDLDQDGHKDLVFANAGLSPRVLIAYGDTSGDYALANMVEPGFDLATAGYQLHPDSKIVDAHLVSGNSGSALAFVVSGVVGQPGSPPAVVCLERGTQPRTFRSIQSTDLQMFPGPTRAFVASAAGDLTGKGSLDLVVGAVGDEDDPLWVFSYTSTGLRQAIGAVDTGVEQVRGIKSVGYGLATVDGAHHQLSDRSAVYVTHEARVAGGIENRVSTFYAVPGNTPALLPPSPARQLEETILQIVIGRFRTRSAFEAVGDSSDAWAVVAGGLRSLQNDGLGEISLSGPTIPAAGLVPASLTRVFAGHSTGSLESPCILTVDGRIGMVLPVDPTTIVWAGDNNPIDLRKSAPLVLQTRSVQPQSSIQCGDLDGDGINDLVVLLNLASQPGSGLESESSILFLRGLYDPPQGAFPYELTLTSSAVANSMTHGNATALVLGDFAIQTTAPNPLEIAVVIPEGSPGVAADGNHVRVYRYKASTEEIVRSSTDPSNTVWVLGDEPECAIAADYNGDGRTDLAVASRGDSMLRVLYNFSPQRGASGVDVDLGSFQEAPANPLPFSGTPLEMLGGDLNGDNVPDVVIATTSMNGALRDQQVFFFLSPGKLSGVISQGVVPSERTGNLVVSGSSWVLRNGTASLGLGDLNGDNSPDLVIGWESLSKGDYNLRVLFGNSF